MRIMLDRLATVAPLRAGRGSYHERLGFTPAEAAAARPEGGSRQACRKTIAYTHARKTTQYDGESAQDTLKLLSVTDVR
jgi:hypothetical protein